jgi:hypothetical protein
MIVDVDSNGLFSPIIGRRLPIVEVVVAPPKLLLPVIGFPPNDGPSRIRLPMDVVAPTLYPPSSTVDDARPNDVANVVAALSLIVVVAPLPGGYGVAPPIPPPAAVTIGNVNVGGSHLLSPVS